MESIYRLIIYLEQANFHHAVVCAGARNALLIKAVADSKIFTLWSQPDERAASFFALGLNQNHQKKAFVVTTSGTAASECFSAVIEAHYQESSLLIISADRPRRYENSGAPQAINQIKLFGDYAQYLELSDSEDKWDKRDFVERLNQQDRPLHLNFFLEDPKEQLKRLEGQNLRDQIQAFKSKVKNEEFSSVIEVSSIIQPSTSTPEIDPYNPIVILGPLYKPDKVSLVQNWVNSLSPAIPILNESTSNIKTKCSFNLDENSIQKSLQQGLICSIIKVGSTPTHRIWRDIDDFFGQLPVYNFTDMSYPGLSRKSQVYNFKLKDLVRTQIKNSFPPNLFFEINNQKIKARNNLIRQYPLSELSWLHRIKIVNQNSRVYLGNSLPVRYWDIAGEVPVEEVWANRGANGIDGQLSSFLGWTLNHVDQKSNFIGVFGDLTTFYDMQALWIYHQFEARFQKLKIQIWIINNQGGQIFKRVSADPLFINNHRLDFSYLAKMFSVAYSSLKRESDFIIDSLPLKIYEVFPDSEQQEEFNLKWKNS